MLKWFNSAVDISKLLSYGENNHADVAPWSSFSADSTCCKITNVGMERFSSIVVRVCPRVCVFVSVCQVNFPCLCSVEENCALWQIPHHAFKSIDIIDLSLPSLLILMLPFHICSSHIYPPQALAIERWNVCLCLNHMCSQSEKFCHSCYYVWMRWRTYFIMKNKNIRADFILFYFRSKYFLMLICIRGQKSAIQNQI